MRIFGSAIQSTLYDDYRRRVVVPLVNKSALSKIANPRFNPIFRIKGQSVVLHPLEIVSVAKENLGERVGSLEEEGDKIIAALDELLTRCH
jgi:toxin CcdB